MKFLLGGQENAAQTYHAISAPCKGYFTDLRFYALHQTNTTGYFYFGKDVTHVVSDFPLSSEEVGILPDTRRSGVFINIIEAGIWHTAYNGRKVYCKKGEQLSLVGESSTATSHLFVTGEFIPAVGETIKYTKYLSLDGADPDFAINKNSMEITTNGTITRLKIDFMSIESTNDVIGEIIVKKLGRGHYKSSVPSSFGSIDGEGFDSSDIDSRQIIGGDQLGTFPFASSAGNPMIQQPQEWLDTPVNEGDFLVISRETRGIEDPNTLKCRITFDVVVGRQYDTQIGSWIEGEELINLDSMSQESI